MTACKGVGGGKCQNKAFHQGVCRACFHWAFTIKVPGWKTGDPSPKCSKENCTRKQTRRFYHFCEVCGDPKNRTDPQYQVTARGAHVSGAS
jgi:hypothetical protein